MSEQEELKEPETPIDDVKTLLVEAFDVIVPEMILTAKELAILDSFFSSETDAELSKRIGLTKKQIRGKRQNINAKFGYLFLHTLKVLKAIKAK